MNSRGLSSISVNLSCSAHMKNLIKGVREEYLTSDDLHQLKNLDEDLFETFKAQRLDDLINGRVRSEYKSPLDKIAHLEAIVEFKMK